jgi:hypothetical protein
LAASRLTKFSPSSLVYRYFLSANSFTLHYNLA